MVFASVVPIALSVLDRPGLETSDERKVKEGELLHTLAERREITPHHGRHVDLAYRR